MHRIRTLYPDLPIVVLITEGDDDSGGDALTHGAQDYVIKGVSEGYSIARAIRHSVQRNRAERYARELALLRFQSAESARVQRGLMPRMLIDDPRVWIRSGYRPGDRRQVLGGDFFDVVQSSPTRLRLVLGDVCGMARMRPRSASSCGSRGGRWCSQALSSYHCCGRWTA